MKTTFKVARKQKTTTEDSYIELTLKDYKGERTFKIDEIDQRHLIEVLDSSVNWQGV